jgi:Glycosyl transferase family 2
MPPPPCERECFTDRGDIWGFDSARVKTAFHYYDFSVNLLDHERCLGVYWVGRADTLPYWVSASPLRTLLHWWMERNGGQLLHAAAIGTEDGAVLLPGKGGAGKSTTALACLAGGLSYLADDYLIVRRHPRPTAYSLYCTAKLDPGRVESFPGLRPFVRCRPGDDKAVLFLHPHLSGQIPAEMPLRAVAIPRITPGREETRFVPESPTVAQQAASFTTMSQLPYVGRHTHEFFGELCAALPCYAAELGSDLERIPAAVRGFLGGLTRQGSAAPAGANRRRDRPVVSVIIPVYNGERFLRDAVHSVLAQRYPSLDIIVVDDGSTDGTEAVARALPCDVRYFKQWNSGPAAARNRAVRDTAGDFIAFLDVDDLWPEDTLSALVDQLVARPELDLVHGYAQLLEYEPATDSYEYRGNPREAFAWYIGAALFRKRVFGTVGLFDPTLTFGEDVDWFNRARELRVPMDRLDAVTLHVRRHGRNMTHGKNPVALNMLRVFKKALDRRRGAAPDRPEAPAAG